MKPVSGLGRLVLLLILPGGRTRPVEDIQEQLKALGLSGPAGSV